MTAEGALFGFDPPAPGPEVVADVAATWWGVTGRQQRLRGERSHNTRITTDDGRSFILQVQSASEDPGAIDLQCAAMRHLERRAPDLPVSRVVPTRSGEALAEVRLDGRTHLARLVTFLPGTIFDPSEALPDDDYRRIGELLGQVAVGLADFEHPAAEHFMPWDLANHLVVDPSLRRDLSDRSRAALAPVDERLVAIDEAMANLPRRTIHNDGHAGNLVRASTGSTAATGLIDFGDLVHTVTAADVAIIAESFAPEHADPAGVLAAVTAGYHAHLALTPAERAALPDLVLTRAALSVLLAEFQIRHAPHLAAGAAAHLTGVIERLVRWSRLDTGAMIERIERSISTTGETIT